MDAFKETYLKERLISDAIDALNVDPERNRQNSYFTIAQIRALGEMAIHDVYPDWKFSDDECNVWELIRSLVRKAKKLEDEEL